MKLLIVGVDGLDPLFLEQFADDLPTFRRLKMECEWFEVRCDARIPNSCAGWMSLYTGMLSHEHGILDWQFDGEWLGLASKMSGQLLWERMNAAGLSVGLLNTPLVWPAYIQKGWCVAGFPTPLHFKRQIERSADYVETERGLYHPPDLAELAPEEYMVDAQDYADAFLEDHDRHTWYMPKILDLARVRTEYAITLLQTRPVDVLFVVYVMLDRLLHALGYFLPSRRHVSEVEGRIWMGYVLMDALLAHLIRAADAEALLVCADHGLNFSTNALAVGPDSSPIAGDPYLLNHTWTTVGFAQKSGLTLPERLLEEKDLTWLSHYADAFLDLPQGRLPATEQQLSSEEDQKVVKDKLKGLGYL